MKEIAVAFFRVCVTENVHNSLALCQNSTSQMHSTQITDAGSTCHSYHVYDDWKSQTREHASMVTPHHRRVYTICICDNSSHRHVLSTHVCDEALFQTCAHKMCLWWLLIVDVCRWNRSVMMVYKNKTEDVSYFILQVYNQNFHMHRVIMHSIFYESQSTQRYSTVLKTTNFWSELHGTISSKKIKIIIIIEE